jgi:hypothetical protein
MTRRFRIAILAGLIPLAAACTTVLEPLTLRPVLEITSADTGTADDASLTPIVLHVDTSLSIQKRAISMSTTAGTFLPGSGNSAMVSPNAVGSATVILRAPSDSTTAIVSATVNGVTEQTRIIFRRALAERVELVAEKATLSAGVNQEVTIVATLRRTMGKSSPGAAVVFTATDASGDDKPIGVFRPEVGTSLADGTVSTRFSVGEGTTRGPIRIRAASGSAIGEATLVITEP